MVKHSESLLVPAGLSPTDEVLSSATQFIADFSPVETALEVPLVLEYDQKSDTYYVTCHISASSLVEKVDLDAVLDPNESEDFKLNRELYLDTYAYKRMEEDAIAGRSFEDLVIEFDKSYRPMRPLKVYGGQHRVTAIKAAVAAGVDRPHGIRVYFELSEDQRAEIAIVNNTSIAVSNDLLDRMQEELLGSQLRDWAQKVGLLEADQNFADRRSSEGVPTVRIGRTLITNYYAGKAANKDDFHTPVVCGSGPGVDNGYAAIRACIDWNDPQLRKMGEEFARLHHLQRQRVIGRPKDHHMEFANKALHPAVTSSWAYAAGYLESHDPEALAAHYGLPDTAKGSSDPLNAPDLVRARLKGTDPDTYRGLGARYGADEIRRMLELFLLRSKHAPDKPLNLKTANAAIKAYVAKKATYEAQKAVEGL